ncbi:hypothetical protein LshimejAT787_1401810 [Lyophyllum shimeji]|uniref:Uncharacterized protein n=1 Tax=Lyophyllum shimeji TaxID=47721 RepID=A0A9P3PY17_LYOSH|nr:hypothetical protein LshimejAT787_1401810 [Lyophyllum shimeji]
MLSSKSYEYAMSAASRHVLDEFNVYDAVVCINSRLALQIRHHLSLASFVRGATADKPWYPVPPDAIQSVNELAGYSGNTA